MWRVLPLTWILKLSWDSKIWFDFKLNLTSAIGNMVNHNIYKAMFPAIMPWPMTGCTHAAGLWTGGKWKYATPCCTPATGHPTSQPSASAPWIRIIWTWKHFWWLSHLIWCLWASCRKTACVRWGDHLLLVDSCWSSFNGPIRGFVGCCFNKVQHVRSRVQVT